MWPYFRHAMKNHYCTRKQFLFKELCSEMRDEKLSFSVRWLLSWKIRSHGFPLFHALKLHSRLLWKYNESAAKHTCVNTWNIFPEQLFCIVYNCRRGDISSYKALPLLDRKKTTLHSSRWLNQRPILLNYHINTYKGPWLNWYSLENCF